MATRKTRKSGASKKRSTSGKATPSKPLSGVWRLAAALLLAGVFIAGLYTLAKVEAPSSAPSNNKNSVSATQSAATNVEETTSLKDYTFYSLLKDFKVDIPGASPHANTKAETSSVTYMIQAGSFKTESQASQQRAELILLELSPSIERTTNSKGEVWYRVTLGPYRSRSAMASARTTLISNRFDAMVMTRKNQ